MLHLSYYNLLKKLERVRAEGGDDAVLKNELAALEARVRARPLAVRATPEFRRARDVGALAGDLDLLAVRATPEFRALCHLVGGKSPIETEVRAVDALRVELKIS